ncbi:hypothetical protein DFA_04188 [Cavenderia fasciculata]|uniref:Uncharacterized protein n=1 Tax=Cavenderia fasciculata TaxID=261658 RepID=F4Q1J1_CACFS|nr:uncharacterized protein DFA_04188 [Cavenderia fasciculata]EGG18692.1 hypothetical protein DFA_04188 [Cavenderia fasciculata]|eukprot:XP_004366596.1 hypothetical protein DFA_04188 [Cavenderia fasciculata]
MYSNLNIISLLSLVMDLTVRIKCKICGSEESTSIEEFRLHGINHCIPSVARYFGLTRLDNLSKLLLLDQQLQQQQQQQQQQHHDEITSMVEEEEDNQHDIVKKRKRDHQHNN